MSIGTALVIIAILYLIEKHKLWRKGGKVFIGALLIGLFGLGGYYAWSLWKETKASRESQESERKAQAALEAQRKVVSDEPVWNLPAPPEGFIPDDVSEAILYPTNADNNEKTKAWKWYHASVCVTISSLTEHDKYIPRIAHGTELFNFDSYDNRWMKDLQLPNLVKRSLWSAKIAECRLDPGSSGIRACLDRATGTVDSGPWMRYASNCSPKQEMVHLSAPK